MNAQTIAREADTALRDARSKLRNPETGMLYHQDIKDALRLAEKACGKLTTLETIARGVPPPKTGENGA